MSPFDLIIFDCDGTLVDSELLCNIASSEVLVDAGYTQYTPEYCLQNFMGAGQSLIWRTVAQETGGTLPPDINQLFIDRVTANIAMARPAPGIENILAKISRTHKICVGSNGERPNVVGVLKSTGLMKYFADDHIFTVEDITHPKPAPDLYLHAARQMKIKPDRCLVVEDSVAGATAGVAAGMTVFGYYGLAHDQPGQAEKLRKVGVHKLSDDFSDLMLFIQ